MVPVSRPILGGIVGPVTPPTTMLRSGCPHGVVIWVRATESEHGSLIRPPHGRSSMPRGQTPSQLYLSVGQEIGWRRSPLRIRSAPLVHPPVRSSHHPAIGEAVGLRVVAKHFGASTRCRLNGGLTISRRRDSHHSFISSTGQDILDVYVFSEFSPVSCSSTVAQPTGAAG